MNRRSTPARCLVALQSFLCLTLSSVGCSDDDGRRDFEYRRPDPAIAVLPFESPDPDLESTGVDLAVLLAAGLDAVDGLRAVDSRAALAVAGASPASRAPPSGLASPARFGERTAARWVVTGRVERIPGGVSVSLVVHDLERGRSDGAEGIRFDDVRTAPAVDRLTRAVLVRVPDHAEAVPTGLARVASGSPAALRAWLEGERDLREGRLEAAVRAWRRAVATDPGFALAHLRIAEIGPWAEPGFDPLDAATRAVRHETRLAPREAALSEARLDLVHARPERLKALRQVVRRWPDDPDAWFLLGEFLFRLGPAGAARPAEVDLALGRAIARAPGFAPAWAHRVDAAVADGDPRRAATVLDTLRARAPEAWYARDRALRFALAFGDSGARAAAVDTLAASGTLLTAAVEVLRAPRHLELQREALVRARSEDPDAAVAALAWNRARAGRLAESLDVLGDLDPVRRLGLLYGLASRRLPVPDDRIDAASRAVLAEGPAEDAPERFSTGLFFVGARAVDRGEAEVHRSALARLRRGARAAFQRSDTLAARLSVASARALEAWIEFDRSGDRRQAVRGLEGALHDTQGRGAPALVNAQVRWWLAEIHRESGDPHQTLTFYGSFWDDPWARARSGAVHAALGDTAAARADYVAALEGWNDPDPEIREWAGALRRALEALPDLAATR